MRMTTHKNVICLLFVLVLLQLLRCSKMTVFKKLAKRNFFFLGRGGGLILKIAFWLNQNHLIEKQIHIVVWEY